MLRWNRLWRGKNMLGRQRIIFSYLDCEFKNELDYPSVKLMEIGHEAINTLNPMIFNKLVDAQGSGYFCLTIKKINNKSLTIISELKEENSNDVYKRIHTYNENGYESKFELVYKDASMDYSFTVDFIAATFAIIFSPFVYNL